jgi:hypothetical protein
VISGFSLAFIGIFSSFLARILGLSNDLLIIVMFKINYLLALIPGAYFKLPGFSFCRVVGYYLVLLLIFNRFFGVPGYLTNKLRKILVVKNRESAEKY